MQRTPEPEELMEAADQVEAYARADFGQANALFCERLESRAGAELRGRALDLGCGPADIPLTLARRHAGLRFAALDGSAEMLRWAQRAVDDAELGSRVQLVHATLADAALDLASFDYVLSNSLLHHLSEPQGLWSLIERTVRSGGLVHVMDLMRPDSAEDAAAIVARYSGGEPEVLRRDFFASLCAAFTPDEVRAQLEAAGVQWLAVEVVSDRHMAISGRAP